MKSLNDQFTDALEDIGNYGPYQVIISTILHSLFILADFFFEITDLL